MDPTLRTISHMPRTIVYTGEATAENGDQHRITGEFTILDHVEGYMIVETAQGATYEISARQLREAQR